MNFYKTFLNEKTLITILKVVKLYRDLPNLIIENIIDNIVKNEYMEDYYLSEEISDNMEDYYLSE